MHWLKTTILSASIPVARSGGSASRSEAAESAYFSGRCIAYTTDASGLASTRNKVAKNPADHIILPADMRFFDDDDRNFVAYKVAAAHGAARIEFGTYRFQLGDVPDTVEALVDRYGLAPR